MFFWFLVPAVLSIKLHSCRKQAWHFKHRCLRKVTKRHQKARLTLAEKKHALLFHQEWAILGATDSKVRRFTIHSITDYLLPLLLPCFFVGIIFPILFFLNNTIKKIHYACISNDIKSLLDLGVLMVQYLLIEKIPYNFIAYL